MVVSLLGQLTWQDHDMPATQITSWLVLPNQPLVEISLPTKVKPMLSWKMNGRLNTTINVILHAPNHIVAFFFKRMETVMMMIRKLLMGYQCNLWWHREPSSGPRRSNRLAFTTPPSILTTLSPLILMLDVGLAPFQTEPPSPSLDHHTLYPSQSQPVPIIPPIPQPSS